MKRIRQLHTAAGRRQQQALLLEGTHQLQEALGVQWPLTQVCCSPDWIARHPHLWAILDTQAIPTRIVGDGVLAALATTVSPDGVVAVAAYPEPRPAALHSLGVLAEQVQDPGNLGTLIRTCAAVGVDALLLSSGSVDWANPKVLRAAAGQALRVPIHPILDPIGYLGTLRPAGFQVIATVPTATTPYWAIDWTQPSLLVLGNEGAGLSEALLACADLHTQVPLQPGVESLNVAIVAAIILYEAKRQRAL
ncbi:MAG: RNA methyltransferase [Gloeomargaritaceae cyanobacterium C42_A2020_066]|nr:RNA methyltransferase [Gloeomargaritaceae cyanobacterium C42_A2020_066]